MSTRIVLIHGLGRTRHSMFRLGLYLNRHNFDTRRFGYRSLNETLSDTGPGLETFLKSWYKEEPQKGPIHLVTHSMGGILARYCEEKNLLPHVHRIVMLGPPNHGCEVAEWFNAHFPRFFKFLMGPNGPRLGTDENSYIARLPNIINHETGIIAGTKNRLFITRFMLPVPNDGLVSVKSTRLEGMKDWTTVPTGHTFMMNDHRVRRLTVKFLREGKFDCSRQNFK